MLALGLHELPHRRRCPRGTILAAGLAVCGNQPCLFAAVARTGVAVGTLVASGSAQVMAGLLGLRVAPNRQLGSEGGWLRVAQYAF
jgi:DME family drug/metabolite transporter